MRAWARRAAAEGIGTFFLLRVGPRAAAENVRPVGVRGPLEEPGDG